MALSSSINYFLHYFFYTIIFRVNFISILTRLYFFFWDTLVCFFPRLTHLVVCLPLHTHMFAFSLLFTPALFSCFISMFISPFFCLDTPAFSFFLVIHTCSYWSLRTPFLPFLFYTHLAYFVTSYQYSSALSFSESHIFALYLVIHTCLPFSSSHPLLPFLFYTHLSHSVTSYQYSSAVSLI